MKMNENIKTLKIEKALSISSYPNYTKNFVNDYLIENYSNNKKVKVYLTLVDKQNLFIIEYTLPKIIEKNRFSTIIILVYLPILFPNYPPEFYISRKGRIEICDEYEKCINKKNLRINLDYFVSFDPIKKNVEEIINCFRNKFTENFPIYKTNDNNIEQPTGKCILDKSKCFLILFGNIKGYEIKESFNDKTFMNYMKNQTKDILREKYMIFKEEFNNIELGLDKLKKNRINKNNNIKQPINKELEKEIGKLLKIKKYLNEIESSLKTKKDKNKSIFDKCSYYIKIKNKKIFELIIKKKVISDYLIYLKKGFEKNIVTFDDMLNKTRKLSREIFYINYTIRKLNNIK